MLDRKKIRLLRERAKMSQDSLAHAIGVSAETVSRVERGAAKHVSTATLEGIASELGVAPGDLLTGAR